MNHFKLGKYYFNKAQEYFNEDRFIDGHNAANNAISSLEIASSRLPSIATDIGITRGQALVRLGEVYWYLFKYTLDQSHLSSKYTIRNGPSSIQWYQQAGLHLMKAIHWFDQARSSGDYQGSLELGYLYKEQFMSGTCFFPEMFALQKAISYFEEVPEESSSFVVACEQQGDIYQILAEEVEGVEGAVRDDYLFRAIECYKKAAQRNSVSAMSSIGAMYYSDYKIKKAPEPATAAVALNSSLDWFERAADLDDVSSIYKLATIYADLPDNGEDNSQTNLETAIKWYVLAASKNNFHAVVALYKLYKNGPFPDFEAAEHWYQFGLGITLGTYEHRLFVRRCSLA
jgi:TPR repeat protein